MVAERAKSVKITDFFMDDEGYDENTSPDPVDWFLPDDALATVENPLDYFYCYFPVLHNDVEQPFVDDRLDFFVNPFDYDLQDFTKWSYPAFPPPPADKVWQRQWAPHFKVGYMLERALRFLVFSVSGSFWSSPDAQQLYIHSELALNTFRSPSNVYMPNLVVSELINQIKDRLKLSIFFDSLNATVVVDTFDTLRSSSNYLDIDRTS